VRIITESGTDYLYRVWSSVGIHLWEGQLTGLYRPNRPTERLLS